MGPDPRVEIALATWHGAAHLGSQLASLERQTVQDFRLVVRDDGSGDGTVPLLRAWIARRARGDLLIEDGRGRLGIIGNFSAALSATRAPVVFLCDQDDVWDPDKIERTLAAMAQAQARHGPQAPLLVHGDARMVAADGRPLHPSFAASMGLDLAHGGELRRLLLRNAVTGCTVAVNRELLSLALPVPAAAIMHDWWLGLVAAGCGHVVAMPGACLDYRQHAGNALGAASGRLWHLLRRYASPGAIRSRFARISAQAEALAERCGARLPAADLSAVSELARLPRYGWWARRGVLIRHRLRLPGLGRRLAAWLLM